MEINRSVFVDGLHLSVLVCFAVAQPLFDILSQNPEFLISHNASPMVIIGLALGLSFGLSLFLFVVEVGVGLVSERFRQTSHGMVILGLSLLIILPIAKQISVAPDSIIFGIGLIGAILFVVFYWRFQPIRMFLNVLSPVVVIFPLWFLLLTPVKGLIFQEDINGQTDLEVKNPVPVVMVVFDEFTLTALLDAAGKIDSIRFPNFAEIAQESWWFPNAIATSPSTRAALPAILSGRQPQSADSLNPTVADFPQNLFTMLGDRYHLNVIESSTSLCPKLYCRQEHQGVGWHGFRILFSDLVVIYLHLIAPPTLGQQLPTLNAQWTGFGREWLNQPSGKTYYPSHPPQFQINAHLYRDSLLSQFLSGIKKADKPTLHFLHTLLPHVAYEFLTSGHKYLPSDGHPFPAGILDEKEGWIGEEPLILTAYHRYLQQIGYVDRFLGQLRQSLETAHLYDNALIILTADHGVSFRRGRSRRNIDRDNTLDILKVPMIVKLPGQKEGKISERLVNGVDVLPTIIDVLQIQTSWDLDGYSMVREMKPPRSKLKVHAGGVFNAQELKGLSRLNWQIDHFQEHSSLDDLVPQGPFSSLIGQAPSNLPVSKRGTMRGSSPDLRHFEQVKPESGFLPALFRAYVLETNKKNLPVAVALNGRIWATTITSEWKGKGNYLSVLLPPAAFKNGKNEMAVYLIEETGEALTPILLVNKRQEVNLQYDNDGHLTLLFSDETEFLVETDPNSLFGNIDRVNNTGNILLIEGWSADIAAHQLVDTVLIFSGKELVSQIKPDISRPDVVKVFQQNELLYSGFRAGIPKDDLKSVASEVRVVALSQGKRAVQLPFTGEQKRLISAVLEKDCIR